MLWTTVRNVRKLGAVALQQSVWRSGGGATAEISIAFVSWRSRVTGESLSTTFLCLPEDLGVVGVSCADFRGVRAFGVILALAGFSTVSVNSSGSCESCDIAALSFLTGVTAAFCLCLMLEGVAGG